MSDFVPVAEVASLPPGHGRTVHVAGRNFAVYNRDGQFYALDDECPHRGGPLGAGMLDAGKVVCPLHGWAFDPQTGVCDLRPDRPVKTYPVRVRDGQIEICIQE
jgi:nitrite reductase (NADH) small subunit